MMKVSVVQMQSVDSWEVNFERLRHFLSDPEMKNRDLICFPENSLYLRVVEGEKIPFKTLDWEGFKELSKIARTLSSNLHLGSLPLEEGDLRYNASVFVSREGSVKVSYQKIHLFDIHLEGKKPIRESDVFQEGRSPQLLTHEDWKIGQSICYDLRFSELYSKYAAEEADVILIPAAFLVSTGKAHWDILVRARAIESQCYVLASCQWGEHRSVKSPGATRWTYGNTMIVDPWGEVVARAENGDQVLHADLRKSVIQKVREQIPMKNHRRLK
jgi:predicted amidohydrolase